MEFVRKNVLLLYVQIVQDFGCVFNLFLAFSFFPFSLWMDGTLTQSLIICLLFVEEKTLRYDLNISFVLIDFFMKY